MTDATGTGFLDGLRLGPGGEALAMAWGRARIPPRAPPVTDRHLRRLLDCGFLNDEHAFEVLSGLPEAWIPATEEEIHAFLRVAQRLRVTHSPAPCTVAWTRPAFVHLLGGYAFLRASRGRWAEYEARFPRLVPGLHDELRGVGDMVTAFAHAVVLPTLFRSRLCDERYDVAPLCVASAIAARILIGEKSLHAILDLSTEWHRVAASHGAATISPWMTWPVPFAEAVAPNGVALGCLAGAEALAREGQAMSHCVLTYGPACAARRSVIVSARDPRGVRLSTVEITPVGAGRFAVSQNLAVRNGQPPAEAVEAAAWLAASLGTPALPVDPAWTTGGAGPASRPDAWIDRMSEAHLDAAARRWAPLLTRPLRTRAALEAAIGRAALDVVRERLPPGLGIRTDGSLAEGNVPWTGDAPAKPGPFQVEALVRMRVPDWSPYDRRRLARLADVGWMPLSILAIVLAGLPLVPVLGRAALAPAMATPFLWLALVAFLRSGPAARLARRRWERRAEALARSGPGHDPSH